jgi:hypothetical protein
VSTLFMHFAEHNKVSHTDLRDLGTILFKCSDISHTMRALAVFVSYPLIK